MKAILITSFLIILGALGLHAQNVGIGTISPQAKLHVKSSQGMVTAFYEGFNEGVINPSYQEGNKNWQIITDNPPVGAYGAGAPSSLKNNETAILSFTINTPIGKDIRISFSAHHNDPSGSLTFTVLKPNGIFYVDHQANWKNYTTNFIATTNPSVIKLRLEAEQDVAFTETFLDEIKVTYTPDPALMIDDGTQFSGGILQSDALGNASWVDLRSEIDQQINGSIQDLAFNTTTNVLSIENGNNVNVSGLSNTASKKLILSTDTILASPGMQLKIPAIQDGLSSLHYDANRASMSWGVAPVSNTYTDAQHSVRWGSNNKVYAEHGSVWGQDNIISFSGKNATVFGVNNQTFGFSSAVWGENNMIESDSLGTAWGRNNQILGKNGSAWGENNSIAINSKTATVWGSNNNVTADNLGSAWGSENTVSTDFGTAWGSQNIVSRHHATAWGTENVASQYYATAWGEKNVADGWHSTSFGYGNNTYGKASTAMGYYTTALSYAEVAIGVYNYTNPFGNTGSYSEDDQIFSIGVGSIGYRENAMTVLKNGNIGIGSGAHEPEYILDIVEYQLTPMYARIENSIDHAGLIINSGYRHHGSILFKLGSDDTAKGEITYKDNTHQLVLQQEDNIDAIVISENGVGFKDNSPFYDIQLANNSAAKPASSSWIVASDRRLKKDIKPFEGGLDLVQKINPVWFTYNGRASMSRETGVGTIAQELERVAPYMVTDWERDGEKYKAVDYGAMDFILVNAIKEQQEQIKELMEIVETQGKQIKELEESRKSTVASK